MSIACDLGLAEPRIADEAQSVPRAGDLFANDAVLETITEQALTGQLTEQATSELEYSKEYDLDACRSLYMSVVELAVQDYRFLQQMEEAEVSSRYDRKKLRQMTEDGDPRDFFSGSWFEEMCDYIGVKPDLIRERLLKENDRLTDEAWVA